MGEEMFIGNEFQIDYTINDEDGTAVDLTAGGNASITWSLKEKSSDAAVLFDRQNTEAGGGDTEIVEVDYSSGTFSVLLVAANTSALEPGMYVFDLEIFTGTTEYTYTADYDYILLKEPITTP